MELDGVIESTIVSEIREFQAYRIRLDEDSDLLLVDEVPVTEKVMADGSSTYFDMADLSRIYTLYGNILEAYTQLHLDSKFHLKNSATYCRERPSEYRLSAYKEAYIQYRVASYSVGGTDPKAFEASLRASLSTKFVKPRSIF